MFPRDEWIFRHAYDEYHSLEGQQKGKSLYLAAILEIRDGFLCIGCNDGDRIGWRDKEVTTEDHIAIAITWKK